MTRNLLRQKLYAKRTLNDVLLLTVLQKRPVFKNGNFLVSSLKKKFLGGKHIFFAKCSDPADILTTKSKLISKNSFTLSEIDMDFVEY